MVTRIGFADGSMQLVLCHHDVLMEDPVDLLGRLPLDHELRGGRRRHRDVQRRRGLGTLRAEVLDLALGTVLGLRRRVGLDVVRVLREGLEARDDVHLLVLGGAVAGVVGVDGLVALRRVRHVLHPPPVVHPARVPPVVHRHVPVLRLLVVHDVAQEGAGVVQLEGVP